MLLIFYFKSKVRLVLQFFGRLSDNPCRLVGGICKDLVLNIQTPCLSPGMLHLGFIPLPKARLQEILTFCRSNV